MDECNQFDEFSCEDLSSCCYWESNGEDGNCESYELSACLITTEENMDFWKFDLDDIIDTWCPEGGCLEFCSEDDIPMTKEEKKLAKEAAAAAELHSTVLLFTATLAFLVGMIL